MSLPDSTKLPDMPDRTTVLLVGIDDHLRAVTRTTLDKPDFEVIEVGDGATALAVARAVVQDLVILDAALPGLDGVSVCRALKAMPQTADIPVILLIDPPKNGSGSVSLACGADAYITKPFSPLKLLEAVARLAGC